MLNVLKKGELEIGEKLTSALKNWLIKHILQHDKIFAKHYFANN
jgi:hemerythrin